ncbi:MAG TPA: DedA family protein [Cytophagaceae bacterium]|jgi:membrane-associated protein
MDLLKQFVDFFLHLDHHLNQIILDYGVWTYVILFLIIFIETGLVVMPFLPGDSLLFAAGAFAAKGSLNLAVLLVLLFLAAFLGDTVNYLIGKFIGPKVFRRDYLLIKRSHLLKTQDFYNKHGGKTIIFARFIPIIRTFAPFIAGVGSMNYSRFITYNIVGGLVWVIGLTLMGYFFGSIPWVERNFEVVIIGIIVLSILPPVIEFIRHKLKPKTVV